ncbi:MAG: hypothetical protein A2508_10165 [Candidatus Lambdaproteobacteria bacterium RIFOXYD12_FULL_49_8]|uniref:Uncharacterized protein n=1 Tax=Candidatus Lambdaproteobacteria bacterium RIFOXYD2_FULL_50_16 TaxID=1817772 RepID=A0A1F6GBF0_9PROT|nr:MAG: hypothetical protein A2527_04845 [Candidatus Lambdaproteobacteria bacterium RIFOXYD2_FULL_50_16]OGG97901.1 MAG: hypothetical protein A2508_10165 [Candidatus Lambdaproteobacteria bacterium RIFOXYD12_FULL_49_8]
MEVFFHPEFNALCEELKRFDQDLYDRFKVKLKILLNTDPRTMEGIEWNKAKDLYTWVFLPNSLKKHHESIEVDLKISGNKIAVVDLYFLPLGIF